MSVRKHKLVNAKQKSKERLEVVKNIVNTSEEARLKMLYVHGRDRSGWKNKVRWTPLTNRESGNQSLFRAETCFALASWDYSSLQMIHHALASKISCFIKALRKCGLRYLPISVSDRTHNPSSLSSCICTYLFNISLQNLFVASLS